MQLFRRDDTRTRIAPLTERRRVPLRSLDMPYAAGAAVEGRKFRQAIEPRGPLGKPHQLRATRATRRRERGTRCFGFTHGRHSRTLVSAIFFIKVGFNFQGHAAKRNGSF